MSISQAFSNALTGLSANSRMAEVVSSNLANAMTDGYARRTVELSSQDLGGHGAGVRVDGITRQINRAVLSDRRNAGAAMSGVDAMTDMLRRVEDLIGGSGENTGLAADVARLEEAFVAAGADPASPIRLEAIVDRLSDLATALNRAGDSVQTFRQEVDAQISAQIETLNTSLEQVAKLNGDITRAIYSGLDPSALIDQRQIVIDRVAELVPLREMDRQGGQVALVGLGGIVLLDGKPNPFEFAPSPTIEAGMSFDSGALSGITRRGEPIDTVGGLRKFAGGAIEASLRLRDEVLPQTQEGLDRFARDLLERFAHSSRDPTLAPGAPGLFTDAGIAFDPLDEMGLSSRISVNSLLVPSQGGDPALVRDGLGSAGIGSVGNAAQIDRWLQALEARLTAAPGLPSEDTAGRVADLQSRMSTARINMEDRLAFESARWETLREKELSYGVDSDQEMQTLMQIEQAYSANARVIQTLDSMIRTLMEI